MKKLLFIFSMLTILLLAALLFLCIKYADNTTLQLTTYQISSEKIPADFNGFRIAQIADLHNTEFGENNTNLLSLLAESAPDIIVFTGDQLDSRKTDKDVVLTFVRQAVQIAPCYLVTGNHEGSLPNMREFLNQLQDSGVIVLDNEMMELTHNGASIDLVGLTDPSMNIELYGYSAEVSLETKLQGIERNNEHYTILLSHRPKYLYVYERNGIDLAICGHNHGGQVRIKGQGLISASKDLLPEYDAGIFTLGDTTMVLSRGLGNSIFPWRINNPPEVVIIELNTQA